MAEAHLEGIVQRLVADLILDLRRRVIALESRPRPREVRTSQTWDPPSLTAGSTTLIDVSAPGAELGGIVRVSFSATGSLAVRLWGNVSVAGTVRVFLKNESGSTVNLGSGTLRTRTENP